MARSTTREYVFADYGPYLVMVTAAGDAPAAWFVRDLRTGSDTPCVGPAAAKQLAHDRYLATAEDNYLVEVVDDHAGLRHAGVGHPTPGTSPEMRRFLGARTLCGVRVQHGDGSRWRRWGTPLAGESHLERITCSACRAELNRLGIDAEGHRELWFAG
jgi:hypothetical protein